MKKLSFSIVFSLMGVLSIAQENITFNPAWYNPAFAGSKETHRVTYSVDGIGFSLGLSANNKVTHFENYTSKGVISYDTYIPKLKSGVGLYYRKGLYSFSFAPKLNLNGNWLISPAYKINFPITQKTAYKYTDPAHDLGLTLNNKKTLIGGTISFASIDQLNEGLVNKSRVYRFHLNHDFGKKGKWNYAPLLSAKYRSDQTLYGAKDIVETNLEASIIHYFYKGNFRFGIVTGLEVNNSPRDNDFQRFLTGITANKTIKQWKFSASILLNTKRLATKSILEVYDNDSPKLSISYTFKKKEGQH